MAEMISFPGLVDTHWFGVTYFEAVKNEHISYVSVSIL
jgi:hypothetical protein